MAKLTIGVLRGGPSSEYDVSLKTGAAMLEHLPQEKYVGRDILIDKSGQWHMRGMPIAPEKALQTLDAVLIGLHGKYGEDGTVQRLLKAHGKPFAGSDHIGSALSLHKIHAKERASQLEVPVLKHRVIFRDDLQEPSKLVSYYRSFAPPLVIKPISGGSSVGVTLAVTFEDFRRALENALVEDEQVMMEEYVMGREATVGVLNNFRNQSVYSLPEIEIVPNKQNKFFDYKAKYSGESEEICPGRFSKELKDELGRLAKLVHEGFGLRHYSRTDFMISNRGKIYFLEVNTLPGLTPASLIPKSLDAVGCTFPQFLEHLISQTLSTK